MPSIQEQLFALQDLSYRDFHSRLMPTIEKEAIIGVRTPALRKLGKELLKEECYNDFLKELPHQYYEENNLHGFFIENMKDYEEALEEIERFLPYVDNWATCDMMSPKVFRTNRDALLAEIVRWLASNHTYTIRFGVNMLLKFYLDEAFEPKHLEWVAAIQSEEYYVKMVVAWYFATALSKQYVATIPYIEKQRLDRWTHNKTIQKAVESYRITGEQKEYLKTFRIHRMNINK